MKATDFFCLSRLLKPIIFGFFLCYALPAVAEQPSPEAFSQSSQLILSLSDKYIESSITNNMRRPARSASNVQSDAEQSRAAGIGCGMDVTPLAASDGSFGNRMVGKCNFNYHY